MASKILGSYTKITKYLWNKIIILTGIFDIYNFIFIIFIGKMNCSLTPSIKILLPKFL